MVSARVGLSSQRPQEGASAHRRRRARGRVELAATHEGEISAGRVGLAAPHDGAKPAGYIRVAATHGGGNPAVLGPEDLERLRELIRQQPDATLEECRQRLGASCSTMTISRALRKLGLKTQADLIRYALRRGMIPAL